MISVLRDFLLQMSRSPVNYWAEFGLDIPLGAALIYLGLRRPDITYSAAFLTILIGLFAFSHFEYIIHRWLFHGSIPIFVQGHLAHHKNPQGYDALPFFLPSLIILDRLFVLLMPTSYAFLLAGTIAFGYVTYGLGHFSIHHVHFRQPWPNVGPLSITFITTIPKATSGLPHRCGTSYSARVLSCPISKSFRHGPR